MDILFKIKTETNYKTFKDALKYIKDKINERIGGNIIDNYVNVVYYFYIFDMNNERINRLENLYPNDNFIGFFDLFLKILFQEIITNNSEINIPNSMRDPNYWSTLINRINELNRDIENPNISILSVI